MLDDFLQDDQDRMGFGRRTARRGSMVRPSHGRSRWWSPSDALSRQPWFGFPGGQEGWLQWRQTGELPLQNGESQPRRLTPEQSTHYYRAPVANIPAETWNAMPSGPPPTFGTAPEQRQVLPVMTRDFLPR